MDIEKLKYLKESEDRVEFKEAQHNYSYAGSEHKDQSERRKCFLGYIVALANEGGGQLVLGMTDKAPRQVVGTNFAVGKVGALEDETYSRLLIRTRMTELYENGLRVLVATVPKRPMGKPLKFEGVPLMRTGESLRNMSDEELFAILSEQEPDFSAKIVDGLSISDLDAQAIDILKNSYTKKQQNPVFRVLPTEQVLSDLKLLVDGRLNYAALLLLGKQLVIEQYLPQAKIIWEFRYTESQIAYDRREVHAGPIFLLIDNIWRIINGHNSNFPVGNGAFIFNMNALNEIVIREAVLNAIAHRDYTIGSEVVIKQLPRKIAIINPGGFPKGVTLENLITVSSTPRSRVMAEVLEKTGLVERSGQGVDKIFSITLSEGKPQPDYSRSDNFQVVLHLDGMVVDRAFFDFIRQSQERRVESMRLNVDDIIGLYHVKSGHKTGVRKDVLEKLQKEGLLVIAREDTIGYRLAPEYYKMAQEETSIGSRYLVAEVDAILVALQGQALKMGDLEEQLVSKGLNRNQIKYIVKKLIDDGIISSQGTGRGTNYTVSKKWSSFIGQELIGRVVGYLRSEYK